MAAVALNYYTCDDTILFRSFFFSLRKYNNIFLLKERTARKKHNV